MSAVGQRIRERRLLAGLSQTQLAGDDLSASYVSLIEAGKRQPGPEALQIIANRLGCRVQDLEGPEDTASLHVDLELAYARLALGHGEAASARERLEPLLERGGLGPRLEDDVRVLLAEALEKCGDLTGGARVLYPVYDRALERRSHVPLARVALRLTNYYLRAGDLQAAVRVGERGLAGVQDLGLTGTEEHMRLAATLMWVYYELGDLNHALAWADHMLALAGEHGSEWGKAAIYWNAALVADAQGRPDTALNLCERALAVMGEHGSNRDLSRLKLQTASLMMKADIDRAAAAAAVLDQTRGDLEDLGGAFDLAVWGTRRAMAALLLGDAAGAEALTRQALLQLTVNPSSHAAEALAILGDCVVAQGRTDEARQHYIAAGEVLRGCAANRDAAMQWRELGERWLMAGDRDRAMEAFRTSLSVAGIQGFVGTAQVAFGLRPPAPSVTPSVTETPTTEAAEPM